VRILVTGGAGFMGSRFTEHVLSRWPHCTVTVLDKLTYAGTIENLASVWNDSRFRFVHGDICSAVTVGETIPGHTHIVNFAAETHVDRSILDSGDFVRTDVEGTCVLLEQARRTPVERFLQVSTDEVYGDLESPLRAGEDTPLRPGSPYSASKAAGDLMVSAYHATHGIPTLITRGSNTYGPRQHPEKLIPLCITNALLGLPLPVYGEGRQMRDWMHVDDHCMGIATILERGVPGQVYNLGVGQERANIEVVEDIVARTGCGPELVRFVADRPGHDRRYALNCRKAEALGWSPEVPFDRGLDDTVRWYSRHRDWWGTARSGGFGEYYQEQYSDRLSRAPV
jgi:dTDP-glucose 4,6-dehydratase